MKIPTHKLVTSQYPAVKLIAEYITESQKLLARICSGVISLVLRNSHSIIEIPKHPVELTGKSYPD